MFPNIPVQSQIPEALKMKYKNASPAHLALEAYHTLTARIFSLKTAVSQPYSRTSAARVFKQRMPEEKPGAKPF